MEIDLNRLHLLESVGSGVVLGTKLGGKLLDLLDSQVKGISWKTRRGAIPRWSFKKF